MKTTMIIPSYWARESFLGTRASDVTYDHPTPLDQQGTLKRTLESLAVLNDKDFDLVVLAIANAEDIQQRVETKVSNIISSTPCPIKVHLFSHSHLSRIHEAIRNAGGERFVRLLKLQGYSNIRNMCLFLPHLLASDIAVLIDDDEVFEDPDFMKKARDFIGRTFKGTFVGAVAGFYLQPDGDWLIKREKRPWMDHWDKVEKMNEAFREIIGKGPRLKETPFVFGGNMIVHRDIFRRIPFDPVMTRGEDIDFLINIKMFGHTFFLDNTLAIKHLPPSKSHPIWKQLRQDIYRFMFERAKLLDQEPLDNMIHVSAEELDPYPGAFLKADLEDKIEKASTILANQYLADNKSADAAEALTNIEIAKRGVAIEGNIFRRFIQTKELWEDMMECVMQAELREELKGSFSCS